VALGLGFITPLPAMACAELETPVSKTVVDLNGWPTFEGDVVRFTIKFRNHGACPTEVGRLWDSVPAGFQVIDGSSFVDPPEAGVNATSQNNVVINQLVVPAATAAGPSEVEVHIDAEVTSSVGKHCNEAKYRFGSDLVQETGQACVYVGNAIYATKFHSDPNGDGTLRRGQRLTYTIRLVNYGERDAPDVRLIDLVPDGLRMLAVDRDGGGFTVSVDPLLEIDSIPVARGIREAVNVQFTVIEDGSLPAGSVICNQATVESDDNPTPFTTNAACLVLTDEPVVCDTMPGDIGPIKGYHDGLDVTFTWPVDFDADGGYRLYRVEDKHQLPADGRSGLAREVCSKGNRLATDCSDPGAVDALAPRLYYGVVGLCDDGSEGPS